MTTAARASRVAGDRRPRAYAVREDHHDQHRHGAEELDDDADTASACQPACESRPIAEQRAERQREDDRDAAAAISVPTRPGSRSNVPDLGGRDSGSHFSALELAVAVERG